MCGIAGFVGFDDDALLREMCASLTHRGPDDAGFFTGPGIGLSMRRLAIIDLTTGHQPISNEAGDVHVVFNGELYNYQELTSRLVQAGHTFSTSSDTETIVHLYEDHGLEFVKHLRGMFAIALWDSTRRRLLLARDSPGEKPLYYARRGGRLLFGSEIKAILHGLRSRAVDLQAVCEFLAAGYVAPPRTFHDGVYKLAPGQMLVHEHGKITMHRFRVLPTDNVSELSFDESADRLAELLSDAVRLCLKSDVEVGAFLSGGLDSSVIVALMKKHEANVKTFSVGYRGAAQGFNELAYAKRVADDQGTDHHELILEAHSTIELLPRILWHYDEPHGEPTSALVYLLCQFTRQHVKVAVGGTGGDEVFFGYARHKGVRLLQYYRLVPRWLREQLIERVVRRFPESTRGSRFAKRAKRFVASGSLTPDEAYLSWTSLLHRDVRASLLSPQVLAQAEDPTGEAFMRDVLTGSAHRGLLERAAALDVGGYLPEYQLAYMDRMSMAHGLEVRSPFCDHRLLQFATELPASYRLKGTRSKHILKRVAARWIPKDIAEREKVGFDSPIGQWIKDELREFVLGFLSRDQIRRSGLLDPEGVERVLGEHLAGRRDYSLQIWSLLVLEAWYRMYIENRVSDADDCDLSLLRGAETMSVPSVDGVPAF